MKCKSYFSLCAAVAFLTACNQKPATVAEAHLSATNSARLLQNDSHQPVLNAKTNLLETKDQFLAATREKLRELDAKIKELGKNSDSYRDEAKAQADKALANLRERREQLNKQFEDLRKPSAEAWAEIKAGFSAAMDDLEKACDKAREKFKDQ